MDSLQPPIRMYFNVKAVTRFLAAYKVPYGKHKKYIELEIALRFVLNLDRTQRRMHRIGFPALSESDERITLADVFDRKMALDEDIDIIIAPKGEEQKTEYRLQIVRFTGDAERSTQGLLNFLKEKKFNIQKDKRLFLLVWLEKGLKLNYVELGQRLKEINIPYGQIFSSWRNQVW